MRDYPLLATTPGKLLGHPSKPVGPYTAITVMA